MKQPHLLIIRATPGTGKSTYAKKLQKQFNTEHFENDMYLMKNGEYVWTPETAKEAAKRCFEDTMSALKAGKDVIVSNVFVTRNAVDRYVNAAKKLGAKVMVIRMTHEYGNVHNVPAATLASMKAHFEDYSGEILK